MATLETLSLKIEASNFSQYASPSEDPLGELSAFELGMRRFCFEYNHRVLLELGNETIQIFFDPDICIILEDDLPKQIAELSQGQPIEILLAESCQMIIKLVPWGNKVICQLREFGRSHHQKRFELDKQQVLGALKNFLDNMMEMAVEGGYIAPEDKDEFLHPLLRLDANIKERKIGQRAKIASTRFQKIHGLELTR